jgi:GNAT superfamily N-acetyltransferase
MTAPVAIRPMTPEDVAAADDVARDALWGGGPPDDPEPMIRRARARIAHLQRTDPGGAWVAEAGGRVAGVALALVREGIWGLSLFAVATEHRDRGVGRKLLEASFGHGADARGHIVLSTEHPAAMRRYARLGLDLHPCVAAAGVVRRDLLPAGAPDGVHEAGAEGIPVADAIGRAVRGAGHGVDLPVMLEHGSRLLLLEDRAFAVVREDRLTLLAALDEPSAIRVLQAALATVPPGGTVAVDFLTAGQDWAVRACLDVGLALSPDGPMFTAGALGPMRPYIPSPPYL